MCFNLFGNAKRITIHECDFSLSEDKTRIALISDLHFPMCPPEIDRIYEELLLLKSDIIVVAGDLVSNEKGFAELKLFIEKLCEINVPVVIVPGNHDYSTIRKIELDINDFKEMIYKWCDDLGNNNIYFLISETVNITLINGKSVIFAGFRDFRENDMEADTALAKKAIDEGIEKGNRVVFVCHNPDTILSFESLFATYSDSFPPTLCGHTHGGQIYMPFNFEFALLRKDILPKKNYIHGKYCYKEMDLYITSGLGCDIVPMRFGTTAEIALITV